jgi:hypothetical protein
MTLSGVLCRYVGLWFHWPEHQAGGGWRCTRCGTPGETQGDLLGVDYTVDFWKLSEATRKQLSGETAPEAKPAPIVVPEGNTNVRAFSRVAV